MNLIMCNNTELNIKHRSAYIYIYNVHGYEHIKLRNTA